MMWLIAGVGVLLIVGMVVFAVGGTWSYVDEDGNERTVD